MEDEVVIEEFPDYVIRRDGMVFTAWKHVPRKPSRTQAGAVKITLFRNGLAYTKSLPLLVAKAHLYNDFDPDIFDTPIHLDNDPMNNHVDNLAWRPRWFAVKYSRQYWQENYRNARTRIEDVDTGVIYDGFVEPCQKYGLLYHDIIESCTRGKSVFPTWKVFRFV
jgi:hypothetical protein